MKNSGFTLIELSIVLVIIGLIVGGVLVGQDLINAAKQRQVASKHTEFQTAWSAFRLKYNCLPGDCNKAASFFTGNAANIGDGNKRVSWTTNVSGRIERQLIWDHLIASDLWRPEMWGTNYAYTPHNQRRLFWFMGSNDAQLADLYVGVSDHTGNSLQTAYNQSFDSQPKGAVDTPLFTQNIDTKIDDGFPKSGLFQSGHGEEREVDPEVAAVCHITVGSTEEYNVTNNEVACRYSFKIY